MKGQAPSNDNCSNSIILTTNTTCVQVSGTVASATSSGILVATTCSSSNPNDDVWYSFVATCSSEAIQVMGSSNFDPCYEIFSGNCGNLTSILCNAPGGRQGGMVYGQITVVVGQTYFVRVYDYGSGYPTTPSFSICVKNAQPQNDNCTGAVQLTVSSNCIQQTGDVCGATGGFGTSSCGGDTDDDVYYTFLTNNDMTTTYTISVIGSPSFDAVVQVSYGCTQGPGWCANSTAAGGSETVVLSGLDVGHYYHIRVWDYGTGYPATTTFSVCVINSFSNGIEKINASNYDIIVSPNPFSTQTIIHSEYFLNMATLTIYNSFGQQIKQQTNISGQTITLLREELSNGLYIFHLTEKNDIIKSGKLLITN